ncbi:MAG: RNA-guided pseudouridylation complex pseudouridine synthase subunit Cbf5 [archaeon]
MKPIKELLDFSLINIDKPAGPTSYSVSEFIRRQLGVKKTAHMGTLDPKVTGVLPTTLGRACKLAEYFIKHDKSYVGILHTHKEQDIAELQKLIDNNFVGKIKQTPPHRSAVKREERERTVYSWKLLESFEDGKDFLFECKVEGGTYIRKLCSDLGEMIGGAHMGELRRTEAGIFSENKIYNLFEFKSAVDKYRNGDETDLRKMLIPAEDAIKQVLPVVEVEKKAIGSLHIGRPLFRDTITSDVKKIKVKSTFAVFCEKQFIGIYRRTTGDIIFGKSEFVFN